MLRTLRSCCVLAVILSAAFALAQTEFSAEISDTHGQAKTSRSKVYFSKDKMRFDSLDQDTRSAGSAIINLSDQSTTILMTQQHMYMVMPAANSQRREAFSLFHISDVQNACSEWLKLARNQGGTCRKVGEETVNGRNAVKYEGTDSNGKTSQVWLDPKLQFPLKWHSGDSTGELTNIKEGSQPSSLFEIPSGYTKMDMGSMMQRH